MDSASVSGEFTYRGDGRHRVLVAGPNKNYGGVEMVLARFMDALSGRLVFDTLAFDDLLQPEFYANGNHVIRLPKRGGHPVAYERAVRRFFKSRGHEYDAVWSNHNSFGNLDYLTYGKAAGIPVRVCHYHNTAILGSRIDGILSHFNREKVPDVSTHLIACSPEAGVFAYGDLPFDVVNNAFDIGSFQFSALARRRVRASLGCEDSFVVGTVGRLAPQKNHRYLISLFPRIKKERRDARLVIVGAGELEEELRRQVRNLDLEDEIVFTGERDDVSVLLNAFDVFVLPSHYEGLGVSLVEAQANGLPCIASTGVPVSARASYSVDFIRLDDETEWVRAIAHNDRSSFKPDKRRMSAFDIRVESEKLGDILTGGCE